MLLSVLTLTASAVALWIGARLFVGAAMRVADRFGLSDLAIGLTVAAVGTSLPEVAVSVEAALTGRPDVAVGNVVGSSVFNVAVILGMLALVRVIPVTQRLILRDGLAVLGTTLLLVVLIVDLRVSRGEGLLLLGLYVAYVVAVLRLAPDEDEAAGDGDGGGSGGDPDDASAGTLAPTDAVLGGADVGPRAESLPTLTPSADAPESIRTDLPRLLAGLGLVVIGGRFLVAAATELARAAGISEWVIGATVVAAGTSTPEFAVSVIALGRGTAGVSVGNVLGSNVFNVLIVLGLAATVSPMAVAPAAIQSALWLAALTAGVVGLLWSGHRLTRPEGGLLVGTEAIRWLLGLR